MRRPAGPSRFLSEVEMESIHQAAVRILDGVGMEEVMSMLFPPRAGFAASAP